MQDDVGATCVVALFLADVMHRARLAQFVDTVAAQRCAHPMRKRVMRFARWATTRVAPTAGDEDLATLSPRRHLL
jgi:hypothetical protein